MKRVIYLASGNNLKLVQYKKILELLQKDEYYEIIPIKNESEEPYDTLLENARSKVKAVKDKYPVIGDDRGLFVRELNGFPGVKTKRTKIGDGSPEAIANYICKNAAGSHAEIRCVAVLRTKDSYIIKGNKILGYVPKTPDLSEKDKCWSYGVIEPKKGVSLVKLLRDDKMEYCSIFKPFTRFIEILDELDDTDFDLV